MWLPGFTRWELPGKAGVPYDEYDDPKAMWHSTQGTSVEGAVSAYAPYPPHLIVDPWRKRKFQHISLLSGAYALWNEDADDSRCVQIEVVGYAEDAKNWPDEVNRWLGEEVARPLHEHFGVPYVAVWKGFKGPEDVNYTLASASSPLRLTQRELDSFSGHLAHQHSPGDSHWDAPFRMDKILAYAQGEDDVNLFEPNQLVVNGVGYSFASALHYLLAAEHQRSGIPSDPDGKMPGDPHGTPLFTDNPGTPEARTIRVRDFYNELRAIPGMIERLSLGGVDPEALAAALAPLLPAAPSAQQNAEATVAELKKPGN